MANRATSIAAVISQTDQANRRAVRCLMIGFCPRALSKEGGGPHPPRGASTPAGVVVGKYVGETAKNPRRLFQRSERDGAHRLFDEADGALGKRSEVKSAHDRAANILVNYVLSRMGP
jgi:hypothetical protein